jgi:AAA15 family ATPase/GTPase
MIDSQSEKLSKLNEEMNIIFECNSDLEEKLYKEKKLKVKARIERNKLYKANQEQGKEISRQSTLDRLNEGNLNCLDYYRERIDVEGHEGELLKPECTQVDIRMSPELNQEFENIAMSFGDVMEALKENKDESIDPMDKLLPRLVFVGILSGVSLLVAIVAVCNSLI